MKWFVLVVFLICCGGYVEMGALKKDASIATEASAFDEEDIPPSSPLGAECLAGSTWKDDCNECRCTRAGRRACTGRTCPPDPRMESEIDYERRGNRSESCNATDLHNSRNKHEKLNIRGRSRGQKLVDNMDNSRPYHQHVMCAPNTTWSNPCAECSCSPEGVPGCYLKTCSHLMGNIGSSVVDETKALPPKTIPLNKITYSEFECLPGTAWKSACHSCRCSEHSVAECVKILDCDNQEGEPIRCQPGSTFARECNWCRCLESGHVLCTLQECAPPRQVQEEVLGVGKQCEVGTQWRSGCSRCHCESSGEAYCTQDTCPGQESHHVMRCGPGTRWRDGCKRCECSDNATAACAESLCGEGQRPDVQDDTLGVGKECKFGSGWRNRCNKCYCSRDGNTYCTVNWCPGDDNEARMMHCAPGSRWQYECNGCYCTPEGWTRCTLMGCDHEETGSLGDARVSNLKSSKPANLESDKSSNKTIVCQANSMFTKDCNTCWCNDDGTSYFCTRRVCVPNSPDDVEIEDVKPEDLRVFQRECRPNELFEFECNKCRCDPDGKSFSCTRRLCAIDAPTFTEVDPDEQNTTLTRRPRRDVNNKGPVKTCLPGQEFRLDCNKCLCDNEGQDFSCTRLDCAALNNHNGGSRLKREVIQQAVNQCEPGTVFEQGCNVCRCTSDGRHATCSLKKCNTKPSAQEEESQPDSNFRCTPGEQFKRTCNDCTCSADGRSIFCTLRLCENDIAGKI